MTHSNSRYTGTLITITYSPADVVVSDDRGTVAGARIEVRSGERVDTYTIIPPEGSYPVCWLGEADRLLDLEDEGYEGEDGDLVSDLGAIAHAAAEGASGTIHWTAR